MPDYAALRDKLDAKIVGIRDYPVPYTQDRKYSPFRSTWKQTLVILEREVRKLNGENVVAEIGYTPGMIRQDGLPRVDAKLYTPAFVISFDCDKGHLRLFHDGFQHFEDNVHAIALHLENLRHAGLYGVGQSGEQYKGWLQIEAKSEELQFADWEQAAFWIYTAATDQPWQHAGVNALLDKIGDYYRLAAKRLHPDQPGGSVAAFQLLQEAKQLIINTIGDF